MSDQTTRLLYQKLGITEDASVSIINAPFDYWARIGLDQKNVAVKSETKNESLDFIHIFSFQRSELEEQLIKYVPCLKKNGMLWISWPKKSANIESNLSKFIIFELGQAAGLVDVKVLSMSEDWSSLKFVYRIKDR